MWISCSKEAIHASSSLHSLVLSLTLFLPQVLNLERVQELETWLKTTNTKLTQVNGQRKYGGPPEGERGFSGHTVLTLQ